MASQRIHRPIDPSSSPNRVIEALPVRDDDTLQTTNDPVRWALRWVGRIVFEITPLLIIAGFFWLQFQIGARTEGILNSVLTAMTVVVEIGLIFVWSLFCPE
jgi:hypothetical protein